MRRPGLARQNYRGREVAFPAGAVLVACSLIALAPLAILNDRADLDLLDPELGRWAVYVFGVALLGLIDDALGRGAEADTPRGWRGHAEAVLSGRFSTGCIKAVGALALAAFATSGRGRHDLATWSTCCPAALTTNLFNLLDLRPGAPRRRSRCSSPGSASAPGRRRRSTSSACSSARLRSAPCSRFASGRCSATRAPT